MPPSQDPPIPPEFSPYVMAWRVTQLRDREVLDLLILPGHSAPSAGLRQALDGWLGDWYWSDEPGGRWLVLSRRRRLPAERWWLHGLLLLVTVLTTTIAGAAFQGRIEVNDAWGLLRGHAAIRGDPVAALASGLVFSLPLIGILLAHELGHFLTARRYQLDVSPPYFIPVPLWPSFIGTMGAFIRLRTLLGDRRQLLDVGIAGPIAGFVVAVPALVAGLLMSHAIPPFPDAGGMVLLVGGDRLVLGDSLVTLIARWLVRGDLGPILLHPLAFAGVMGMFVTMINLMPMAQLDGGHILYAALPGRQRSIALAFWLVVLGLGYWWTGWYVWAGLVLALSRGRLDHPAVLVPERPLPRARHRLAWVGLVLFALTFAPVPFKL